MRRTALLAILTVLISAAILQTLPFAVNASGEYSPDRVNVGFKATVPADVEERVRKHGGVMVSRNKEINFIVVSTPQPERFIEAIKHYPDVKYAERDGIVYAILTPNDPYYATQWGPQDIYAPQAWDTTTGSHSIVIAVIDTGIDYGHPDLKADVWTASDGTHGYDFANGDSDPIDDNGHGTHVSGIAAATINNGVGIAGISQSSIMAVKVLNSQGSGTWSSVADGITWATNHGANIISMSLGGSTFSQAVQDAVAYAWNNNRLLVAAAGNNNGGSVAYPAIYEQVIAVSALDQGDTIASYSSVGPKVELAAPGTSIYSTMPTYTAYLNLLYGYPRNYASLSGTSMACPHVSGVAALVWTANSVLTNGEVKNILDTTAVDLGDSGRDPKYGYGKVNAYAAVQKAVPSTPTAPSAPQGLQATAGDGQVALKWSAPVSVGGSTITQYNIYRGTSSGGQSSMPIGSVLGTSLTYTDTGLTNGVTYYYKVKAVNSVGESPPSDEASATPTAPSTIPTMHVSSIKMWYQKVAPYYIIYMKVTVVDTGNSPVSGATVYLTLTLPSGSKASGSGVTGTDGTVTFLYGPTKRTGIYTSTVMSVIKDGWTCDSKTGVTTASLKVP